MTTHLTHFFDREHGRVFYRVGWWDKTGRYSTKTFSTHVEAKAHEHSMKAREQEA